MEHFGKALSSIEFQATAERIPRIRGPLLISAQTPALDFNVYENTSHVYNHVQKETYTHTYTRIQVHAYTQIYNHTAKQIYTHIHIYVYINSK